MIAEVTLIEDLKNPKKKERAFSVLLDTYQKRLYWHIRKIVLLHEDADDVLQNTFIKIYKGLPSFKGKSNIHTWMYRIAYNEAISFLRKKQKQLQLNSEEMNTRILSDLKADIYFNGDEIEWQLQQALLQLPEKQRTVFQMKYYDDLKFREISEILDTTEGALKASYHHATKKIQSYLAE